MEISYLQKVISLYGNVKNKHSEGITILEVLENIKSGKSVLEQINRLRNESDKSIKSKIKDSLPAVTFSGYFVDERKADSVKDYTNVICLDIDKLGNIEEARSKLISCPYALAIFLSPSGNGYKVLVKVGGDKSNHYQNFKTLEEYFAKELLIKIDSACKDISRCAFLSYDPNLHLNPDSEIWNNNEFMKFKLDSIDSLLKNKTEFTEGNRNQFVFEFAAIAKSQLLDIDSIVFYLTTKYTSHNFDAKEILQTINSVYKNRYSTSISRSLDKEMGLSKWDRCEKYIEENYDIRLNIVASKYEYRRKNSGDKFTELNENSIFRDLQKNNITFPLNNLNTLLGSDFVSKFDPFKGYFNDLLKLEDDGKDHIRLLTSFVKTDDDLWFHNQFVKMLVRSIACALEDKKFNKQVFILVHSQQNSGKSTFCRFLCPEELEEYFHENVAIEKDGLIALSTNFIINMDELATFSKVEINGLKSFISKESIVARLPYGKRQTRMFRRASFVGSTNKDEFLTDETGSVRWLCFELIDKIDFSYKEKVNINLVWRQAYLLYKSGFKYELTQEELEHNELRNKKYQVSSIEQELIQNLFSPSDKDSHGEFLSTSDILLQLKHINQNINFNAQILGKALRQLGFQQTSQYSPDKGQTRKGYYVKRN